MELPVGSDECVSTAKIPRPVLNECQCFSIMLVEEKIEGDWLRGD